MLLIKNDLDLRSSFHDRFFNPISIFKKFSHNDESTTIEQKLSKNTVGNFVLMVLLKQRMKKVLWYYRAYVDILRVTFRPRLAEQI